MTAHKAGAMRLYDALYGPIELSPEIAALMRAPVVQRMRHIRLSNIDSVAMPGIAGLSRYEHVVGTAYLASKVGMASRMTQRDRTTLQAAALLHDWAITAFGHLVEEAFAYLGSGFNHEGKLHELVAGHEAAGVGGVNRQVLRGRETRLLDWCRAVFGSDADRQLQVIVETILGRGELGPAVSGQIDLDNIDNLHRIAYHMGIRIDVEAPLRLARGLLGVTSSGVPIFSTATLKDLESWGALRQEVYSHLMLAQPDFNAKLMLLYATVRAMEARQFDEHDWHLTDVEFVQRLLSSEVKEVRETADRWVAGEFWEMAPVFWLQGKAPEYSRVYEFSRELSLLLRRPCFAYRIKDKRDRELRIQAESGEEHVFGQTPNRWLLGAGSSTKRPFTAGDIAKVREIAQEFFGAKLLPETVSSGGEHNEQGQLL